MKQCYTCKETKNTQEFHKDTQKLDGLSSYCKVCLLSKNKKRRSSIPRNQSIILLNENKICVKCKLNQDLSQFYLSGIGNGRRTECRKCCSEIARIHRKNSGYKNPPKGKIRQKNHSLKCNYGIDLNKYNEILLQQNGNCLICKKNQSEFKNGLFVDHCHETGIVRGLLCGRCNTGLGMFFDNPDFLISASKYINSFKI